MTQFSPIDEKYLTAARSLGMKNPEKMHPDMLMRTLGALTSSPQTAKQGAIASDYRGPGDQARAIASVARRNGIPFHAGLLRTGIPGMAAPVGRSKHQHGNAVDVSENTVGSSAAQGLYSQAQNFGLRQPLPRSDRNHIELDKNAMGPFPAPGLQNYIEGKQMDEDWLAKYGTPNVASNVADVRRRFVGDSERLDPSAISADELVAKYGLHPDDAKQIAAQNGNMALYRDMMSGAIKKPDRGGIGGMIGAALQAVAIPVSYAQRNEGYGALLAKDNLMTRYADKMSDYEKLNQQNELTLASGYIDRLNNITGDRIKRQQALQDKAREDVRFAEMTGRPVTDEMRRAAGLPVQSTASAVTGKAEMAPDQVNGQTDPGYVPPGGNSGWGPGQEIPGVAGPTGIQAPGGASAPAASATPEAQGQFVPPNVKLAQDRYAASLEALKNKKYAGGNALNDIPAIERVYGKDQAKYAMEAIKNDPAYIADSEVAKEQAKVSAELQGKLAESRVQAQKAQPALEESLNRIEDLLSDPNISDDDIKGAMGFFDSWQIPGFDGKMGAEMWSSAKAGEISRDIQTDTNFLAATMKDFVKKPGDGVWTDADQRYLIDMASGKLLGSANRAEALRVVRKLRGKIERTSLADKGDDKTPSTKNLKAPPPADTKELDAAFNAAGIGEVFRHPGTGKYYRRTGKTSIEPIDAERADAVEIPLTREMEERNRRARGKAWQ